MKQIITITEAAALLTLTEADIVAGKCHTSELSKVDGGFLRLEVEALLAKLKKERSFFRMRLA